MADSPSTERPLPPWSDIAEAGGIHAWVVDELKARELWDGDVDTSTLSEGERKKYKARREEERRVRKVLRAHAWQAFRGAHLVHLGTGVFFHDTPDVDRYDIAGLEERHSENELPKLPDAQALAKALELSVQQLRWLAFHREVDTGTHYQRWHVPKRDGSLRLISAPKPLLKKAQRWIAQNITERLPVHGAAHGFLAGRSILTNAQVHAGAATLVKFDIKDFYPSITLPRVKGLLRKAGLGEQVATVLALLCTEAPREVLEIRGKPHYVAAGPRSLPQGAPTSPSITNTLCLRLDARLAGIARSFGMQYTRYADDMTFSSGQRDIPLGRLKAAVRRVVEAEGFVVHPAKTRILRGGRRQTVTGLVVNPAPGRPEARVPRKVRRQLRAALHNRLQGKPGDDSLERLAGLAAYVYMTDPAEGRVYLDQIASLRQQSQEKSS
ncbi:MAG: reverse transcriptase family protein [Nannocystales bacterium]